MTQPEPAQTRHTVDSLTDPELAQLYERAEQAEAKLDAVRKLHQPTANFSWPAFGCTCEPLNTHTRACVQCQRCYPCPTIRAALDPAAD